MAAMLDDKNKSISLLWEVNSIFIFVTLFAKTRNKKSQRKRIFNSKRVALRYQWVVNALHIVFNALWFDLKPVCVSLLLRCVSLPVHCNFLWNVIQRINNALVLVEGSLSVRESSI